MLDVRFRRELAEAPGEFDVAPEQGVAPGDSGCDRVSDGPGSAVEFARGGDEEASALERLQCAGIGEQDQLLGSPPRH